MEKPKHTASIVVNGIRRTIEVETEYDNRRRPYVSEYTYNRVRMSLLEDNRKKGNR